MLKMMFNKCGKLRIHVFERMDVAECLDAQCNYQQINPFAL